MIDNTTPFHAALLPTHGVRGQAQCVLVVKATFDFAGHVAGVGQGVPVHASDVHFDDDPTQTVVRFESDAVAFKPLVDVIVNAVAHAPQARALPFFEAGLQVGDQLRMLRVSGPRHWRHPQGGVPAASSPEPIANLPLRYALAFGGVDKGLGDQFWAPNPSGIGFSSGPVPEGLPLPQIEWAGDVAAGRVRPELPAGFNCYGRTWQPRMALLGNYTDQEMAAKGLATAMPGNFNPQAWNSAHPQLQFRPDWLQAGTRIAMRNLSPAGLEEILLPTVSLGLSATVQGQSLRNRPHFDTVTIEPEAGTYTLTWRWAHDATLDQVSDARVYLGHGFN